MPEERLQKILSQAGIASRRQSEQIKRDPTQEGALVGRTDSAQS